MRKIKCIRSDKCLWVSRELWEKLKTLKVLGINKFEAVGCDISYRNTITYLDYGRERLRVYHLGDNNWEFSIGSSWEFNGHETSTTRYSATQGLQQIRKAGWNKS